MSVVGTMPPFTILETSLSLAALTPDRSTMISCLSASTRTTGSTVTCWFCLNKMRPRPGCTGKSCSLLTLLLDKSSISRLLATGKVKFATLLPSTIASVSVNFGSSPWRPESAAVMEVSCALIANGRSKFSTALFTGQWETSNSLNFGRTLCQSSVLCRFSSCKSCPGTKCTELLHSLKVWRNSHLPLVQAWLIPPATAVWDRSTTWMSPNARRSERFPVTEVLPSRRRCKDCIFSE
mmetsp:Transcript_40951/g.64540  ORF Transcript_40951/g.64540 Transcript_40951/m.64540 type:complete len:237 (-) Transcript_40951:663-1373(-)